MDHEQVLKSIENDLKKRRIFHIKILFFSVSFICIFILSFIYIHIFVLDPLSIDGRYKNLLPRIVISGYSSVVFSIIFVFLSYGLLWLKRLFVLFYQDIIDTWGSFFNKKSKK